jgi:hypothetical protein
MNKPVKRIKPTNKGKNTKRKQPLNRSLRITMSPDRLQHVRKARRPLRFVKVTPTYLRNLFRAARVNKHLHLLRTFRAGRRNRNRRVLISRRSTPARFRRRRGKGPIALRQRRYVANQTLFLRLRRFLIKHGQPRRLRSRRLRSLYRRLAVRRQHTRPTRLNY